MNVFVSYSFDDGDLYLLSLLLKKLRQEGHHVATSDMYVENSEYDISHSDVFLGIITNNSDSIDDVFIEFEIAQDHGLDSILVIEREVSVKDPDFKFIRFDRHNVQPAIDQLFGTTGKKSVKQKSDAGAALVGAGIIVGVAALIALLAGSSKK